MADTGLLAQLMGQAADDGADLQTLRAAVAWVMRMAFALLLVGIAVRTGWPEWAR